MHTHFMPVLVVLHLQLGHGRLLLADSGPRKKERNIVRHAFQLPCLKPLAGKKRTSGFTRRAKAAA